MAGLKLGSVSIQYRARRDEDLVHLARAGDRRAFRELVERYLSRLYTLAFQHLGDEVAASDALSEAVVNAHRGIDNSRASRRPGAWLYLHTLKALVAHRTRQPGLDPA